MKLSTRILIAFSIILLLSFVDATFNYMLSVEVKKNSAFLNKSQEIIRTSGRLSKSMIEMQSSFRGFLLTGNKDILINYYAGGGTLQSNYKKQRVLVKESMQQVRILDSIIVLHHKWKLYADSLVKLRNNLPFQKDSNTFYDLLNQKFKEHYGEILINNIANKFREFDRIEYELREFYGNKLLLSIQRTHFFSVTFFVLTIIVGLVSIFYIVAFISRRISTMVNLAEGISRGHFSTITDNSTDELSSLSNSLNLMSLRLNKNISELQKRNAELDKFAYVVSHDLKAPLRGIHNAIKWIEEDLGHQITPEMQQYLDIIPQRTKRMEKLINGLLDYARTREKTIDERVDVNEMVREIVASIVPRDFKVNIGPLPVIVTERIKLEQVFTNLVSNAVNYSRRENPIITINCKEADQYEFSVKDNGRGIEPEYHEKIFEIFQTLREKDGMESTGIGLAIVKKILEDMHGSIRVISELDKGAEFIFTWPKTNIYTQ